MAFKHLIRRDIVLATRGTAESVADLVLGSQVVDQRSFLFEDLVAQLTRELQRTKKKHLLKSNSNLKPQTAPP